MSEREVMAFFSPQPSSLPLYEAFVSRLKDEFGEVTRRVQKTQITFYNRHVYACVSRQRILPLGRLPRPYLVITLGLPYPLNSERVAVKCEPYPGRWTTHLVIGREEEIDDELMKWVREAYEFALRK